MPRRTRQKASKYRGGQAPTVLDTPQYKEVANLVATVAQSDQAGAHKLVDELMKTLREKEKGLKGAGKDCGCGCGGLKGGAMRGCPEGFTDMGLFCQKYNPIFDKGWNGALWQGLGGGNMEYFEKIDHAQTQADIRKGIEQAFASDGALASAFDPEKNGVNEAFRKFGEGSLEAMESLGNTIIQNFDPNQNGVKEAFQKLGDKLGDDQWWRDTMSDPDTYILLIGTVASVAAMVLSGGTAGPAVVAALGALGPSLNIISAVAQGEPVSPLDIAAVAFSIIPVVGQAAGGFDDVVKATAQASQAAGGQAVSLGRVLTAATKAVVGLKSSVLGNLDEIAAFAKKVIKVGSQGRALLRGPSLSKLLNSGGVTWSKMSQAERVKEVTKQGMKIYDDGVFATMIADIGEDIGLYTIQDIETALKDKEIDPDYVDWDNPPDDYDYVLPATPPLDIRVNGQKLQSSGPPDMGYTPVYNDPTPVRTHVETDAEREQRLANEYQAQAQAANAGYAEQAYQRSLAQERQFNPFAGGSGRPSFSSSYTANMSGAGNEALAYMGTDMSPLTGSGQGRVPNHSFEEFYDRDQADIHAKKVAMVRRRAEERTVKIKPYTQRPELLSATFKEGPYGRDIHGQVAGGRRRHGRKAPILDKGGLPQELVAPPRKAFAAAERFRRAAVKMLKSKSLKGMKKGGDMFPNDIRNPAPAPRETIAQGATRIATEGLTEGEWAKVDPRGWTAEDWTNFAKGADAGFFGLLADPTILGKAVEAVKTGGDFAFGPPIGTVGGEALSKALQGAIYAHEYTYPACEGGQKSGVAGCNEYRDDISEMIKAAMDIAKQYEGYLPYMMKVGEFLMGSGAYRGAFTRGEPQAGEQEVAFYYPAFSGREARGEAMAGTEYAGPRAQGATLQAMPSLSQVAAF